MAGRQIRAMVADMRMLSSDSYRYDVFHKHVVRTLNAADRVALVSAACDVLVSDSYRFDALRLGLGPVLVTMSVETFIRMGNLLRSDAYRFDWAKLYVRSRDPPHVMSTMGRARIAALFRSESYRSDWVTLTDGYDSPNDDDAVALLVPEPDDAKEAPVEGDDDPRACVICEAMRATMATFPCGHANTCYACLVRHVATQQTCPTCREPIVEIRRVFTRS